VKQVCAPIVVQNSTVASFKGFPFKTTVIRTLREASSAFAVPTSTDSATAMAANSRQQTEMITGLFTP
jgi:hypothetical protein